MIEIKRKRFWVYVYSDVDRRIVGKYKIGAHYGVNPLNRIKVQQTTGVSAILEREAAWDVTKLVKKIKKHKPSLKEDSILKYIIERDIRDYLEINLKFERFKEWITCGNMNPIYLAVDEIFKEHSVPVKKPKCKAPIGKFKWQENEVIIPALEHFKTNSRGHSIIYCGGGKTMITYWFIERLSKPNNLAIIALPSLYLVKQTRNSIMEQLNIKQKNWNHICICSDKNADGLSNNTTNINYIKQWLETTQNDPSLRIIFTTYHSSDILSNSIKSLNQEVDIIVFDESHKTTGKRSSKFSYLLSDNNIKANKRWFVTASPKYNLRKRKDNAGFDDENVFGKEINNHSYRKLVKYGVLSKYKIKALGVTNETIKQFIEENVWVKCEDFTEEKQSRMVASLFSLHQAYEKGLVDRVISYHSRNPYAKRFEEAIKKLSKDKHPRFPSFHNLEVYRCSSEFSTHENEKTLKAFSKSKKAIVTNCKYLTEGIDIPSVNGIIFVDPRKSLVDVTQSVGRVVRPYKNKEFGYVILPTIYENGKIINESYGYLGAVLWHISYMDEQLKDDITLAKDRSNNPPVVLPNVLSIVDVFPPDSPDYIDINLDEFYNSIILEAIEWGKTYKNFYTNDELINFFKECTSPAECKRLDRNLTLVYKLRGLLDIQFPNRKRANKQSDAELISELKQYNSPREARKNNRILYDSAYYRKLLKIIWPDYYREGSNTSTKYSEEYVASFVKENNIQTLQELKKVSEGRLGLYDYIKTHKLDKKYNIKSGKLRAINQYTLEGILIKQWESGKFIKQELGFPPGDISACCSGRQKTAHKFIWTYVDQDNNFKLDIK